MKRLPSMLVALALAACGNKSDATTQPNAAAPNAAPAAAPAAPAGLAVGQPQSLAIPAVPGVTLMIAQAGEYQIDVLGAPLDPVAALYRGEDLLELNDDGGEGTNARITKTLEPGTYRLVVLEYRGQALNPTITVTASGKNAAPPTQQAQPGTIAPGQTAQLSVPAMPTLPFQITEPGNYVINVLGAPQDPVAALYNGDRLITRDDDGGEERNSRITQMLAPGAYRIVVLEYKGQAMNTRITLDRIPDPPTAATLAGAGEATVTTRAGTSAIESAVDVVLNVTTAGSYTITAAANGNGDPKIELLQNGTAIGSDDDSGGNRSARLTQDLTPGAYRVRVMSFDNSSIPVRVAVAAPGGGGK